jgi:hypothetical protein
MVELVTLEEGKDRLGIVAASTFRDDVVTDLLQQAQDIVIGYIKKPDYDWTEETVPPRIKAAILLALIRLYAGDDGPIITDAIKAILLRDRDPALA